MVQICCLVAVASGFSPSEMPLAMTHLRASSASLTGVGVGVLAYGFGYFAARKKYSAQSVE